MRKKASDEERLYLKTLKRFGLTDKRGTKAKRVRQVYKPPERKELYSREQIPSLETGAFAGVAPTGNEYKQIVSAQYEIGQAFNKGGFQVLSKKETTEESTGKRR